MRTQTCGPTAVGGTNRQYEKLTVKCRLAVPEGKERPKVYLAFVQTQFRA